MPLFRRSSGQSHYAGFLVCFVLIMLLLPLLALTGQTPNREENSSAPPAGSSTPFDGLSSSDYAANNFYLVQNHLTGEVMALSPADYIKGVVAGEMPASYHTEALKAQAVAAHTYALYQIAAQLAQPDPALNGAYLSTDPEQFQAWLSRDEMKELWGSGFDANYQKLSDAVDAVIGECITYNGSLIVAAFHSLSGGTTESASNVWGQEVPYLLPAESGGDLLSPDYEATVELTDEEVRHALLQLYPDIVLPAAPEEWLAVQTQSESGTVTALTAGDKTLTGRQLRELLRLRSANFTIDYRDGCFAFTTAGYGHGVGMSQYGADYFARQGYDWQQILLHYYTGVTISPISEEPA